MSKLHIHSDNGSWAGCENMLGVFFSSSLVYMKFSISFSYRYTEKYEQGMLKWTKDRLPVKLHPMKFWVTGVYRLGKLFRPFMVLKYFCMMEEVIKLWWLFKKIKPDILHINNGGYFGATSCNSAVIAGKLAGVKRITYMINSATRDRWWERPITALIRRWVTTFVTATFTLALKSSFLTGGKCKVIRNTVRFMVPERKDDVRKRLGWGENRVAFLALGNWEERKGFMELLRAWKLSDFGASFNTRSFLCIVGGGGGSRKYGEKVETEGATTKNVIVVNKDREENLPHDYSIIHACDVLLVPSIGDEDLPNVVLIALMYGVPVITTDVGGIKELISTDLNGAVVPPASWYGFIKWMRLYLDEEEVRERWKTNAGLSFSKACGRHEVIKEWVKVWRAKPWANRSFQ